VARPPALVLGENAEAACVLASARRALAPAAGPGAVADPLERLIDGAPWQTESPDAMTLRADGKYENRT
jgi:hypothetical protein